MGLGLGLGLGFAITLTLSLSRYEYLPAVASAPKLTITDVVPEPTSP